MPVAPNLSTSITAGWAGHVADTNVVHGVVNRIYQQPIGTTRTTSFALAIANSGELIPVNSTSPVVITVPALAAGMWVRIQRVGTGTVSFLPSGVAILVPEGHSSAPEAQNSVVELVWTAATTVLARGGTTPVTTAIDGGTP
jgi:hypothetical protein